MLKRGYDCNYSTNPAQPASMTPKSYSTQGDTIDLTVWKGFYCTYILAE